MMSDMKTARITAGGQVSIPSAVRRRWGTSVVAVHDEGDRLVLRPLPDDPIAAARGAFKERGKPISSDELRKKARADEAQAERRRGR